MIKIINKSFTGGNIIYIYGELYIDGIYFEKEEAINKIKKIYKEYPDDIYNKLSGNYIIVIMDIDEIIVIKSEYCTPVELYYSYTSKGCVIGNCLYEILDYLDEVIPCDKQIQEEFLKKGFLLNKNTLIKNLFKVECGTTVCFNKYKSKPIIKYNINKKIDEELSDINENQYGVVLEKNIKELVENVDNISVTLSSGYDSNYILHLLNKQKNIKEINAYSIGGRVGRNECSKAKYIASLYQNVNFIQSEVNENTFKHLDEIVWRLEGSIFERGIFLQYELAKKVSQCGNDFLLAGEGADQVMHINFDNEEITDKNVWYNNPKIALNYIVLPKSLKMLNSFGIRVAYPYLNKNVVYYLRLLKNKNRDKKYFHMQHVKSCVKEGVAKELNNLGGTTHLTSLFSESSMQEICKDMNIEYDSLNNYELILDDYLKEQYLNCFYRIFIYERDFWKKNNPIVYNGEK